MPPKKSTEPKKIRFLNMSPKQVRRRYQTLKQKKYRKASLQSKGRPPPSKATKTKPRTRKARPCCGLNSKNCKCKPPPGMRKCHLHALSRRWVNTALSTVPNTTDVSIFKRLWPSIVKNYHFGYFWHTLTHTLCSIKSTCCIASLSIKRSCSNRHGFTGKSYRALSRRRSVRVNDGAHRITEAHIFEKSCYPLTSEKRNYYIATVIMWNGPS